jgi:threonine dehydratase
MPAELHPHARQAGAWQRFDGIRSAQALERIHGRVHRTALQRIPCGDPRVELRAKLENTQATGSFKARGAWNQIAQLTAAERALGVVCASSGNHGQAVAWAAKQAGIAATIVMPANAYANKIAACRDNGAEVVLMPTRAEADEEVSRRVARGAVLVHPYDAERTLEGAGTVGLEIAREWPELEVLLVCVGGGGLVAGSSLAVRQELGERVRIFGAEPAGAPTMTSGLRAGEPVHPQITSKVQGLTPSYSGRVNIAICSTTLDGTILLADELIFAAQKELVRMGHKVEPAGAAAYAAAAARSLPAELYQGRSVADPLRIAVTISGGNPDPAQYESVLLELAREGRA